MNASFQPMAFELAQQKLAEAAQPLTDHETVTLDQALGRVLASDVHAQLDAPPADNSAMDGYAIRLADLAGPDTALPISQRVYAGLAPAPLQAGSAARVFTGSLIPAGADTVIIQENAVEQDEHVRFPTGTARLGQNIRLQGEDSRSGAVILPAGSRVSPGALAVLASQGIARLEVVRQLRVGILTTGDELVEPGAARDTQQIFNSNAPMLAGLVSQLGAEVVAQRHARDDDAELAAALRELAAASDLVLTVGGVSVGDKDRIKPVLESLGGSLALWKVRMKPGKPVALAYLGDTPLVCLPGNPVSAFVVFTLLVSPLVRRMQGRRELLPPVTRHPIRLEHPHQDDRENFLRVERRIDGASVNLYPWSRQGSGMLSVLPATDGLARLAPDSEYVDGALVPYYALDAWQR